MAMQSGPSEKTRTDIRDAAILVSVCRISRNEAARVLKINPATLKSKTQRYDDAWQSEIEAAKRVAKLIELSKETDAAPRLPDLFRDFAFLVAHGMGQGEAARRLGLPNNRVYRQRDLWQSEIDRAEHLLQLVKWKPDTELPSKAIRTRMLEAALLIEFGEGIGKTRAAQLLSLHPLTIKRDSNMFQNIWQAEVERSKRLAAIVGRMSPPPPLPDWVQDAAYLVSAHDLSLREAATRLSLPPNTVANFANRSKSLWKKEKAAVQKRLQLAGKQPEIRVPQKAVETKLMRAPRLLLKNLSMEEASRSMGMASGWLQGTIRRYPEIWRLASERAGLDPRIWEPRFRGVTIPVRQRMVRGALIVASGADMAEASRRLDLPARALEISARLHRDLWNALLAEARATLGIPAGTEQRARLFADGKLIKKQPNRNAPVRFVKRLEDTSRSKSKKHGNGQKNGGGRKPAKNTRDIIKNKLNEDPNLTAQKLAGIIGRRTGKKTTAAAVRQMILRMRKDKELPPAPSSDRDENVTK